MLTKVKNALRIKTTAYDAELNILISAALLDLGVAGILSTVLTTDADAIISQAVITYCKMNFGVPEDYDQLKRSYDEQKAQLATCTGYTDWLIEETEDAEE